VASLQNLAHFTAGLSLPHSWQPLHFGFRKLHAPVQPCGKMPLRQKFAQGGSLLPAACWQAAQPLQLPLGMAQLLATPPG